MDHMNTRMGETIDEEKVTWVSEKLGMPVTPEEIATLRTVFNELTSHIPERFMVREDTSVWLGYKSALLCLRRYKAS